MRQHAADRTNDSARESPARAGFLLFTLKIKCKKGVEHNENRVKKIFNFEQVKATEPIASYLGGKRLLAKTIVPIIDKIPHNIYCEPFVGMGGIFFRRTQKPKCEAINDINKELVNMFRMVERFPDYLADMLRFKICSRAEFKRMLATPPLLLTELERAIRFLYIQKNAFGGKVCSQAFGVTLSQVRFNSKRLIPQIQALHERLSSVYIECLPYQEFITRYDRPDTLFYLDPPYWNCEKDYGKDIFGKADFEKLSKLLKGIKGRFILSINDVPEIRVTFKGFYIKEVNTRYTTGIQPGKQASELLICNVDFNTL